MKINAKALLSGFLIIGLCASCEQERNNNNKNDYTEYINGINMPMIYVEGGEFEMGATEEQNEDALSDEYPVRVVRIDSYYIGKYEITQKQWKAVMGNDFSVHESFYEWFPSIEECFGDDFPVFFISMEDAQEFCNKLSEKTGKKYTLPTEAQWEYAARGGIYKMKTKYSGSNDIDAVAWYIGNAEDKVHPVGQKKANILGIYDMTGNVWERCSDFYGTYDEEDIQNPIGPDNGDYYVSRGGSFYTEANDCRVSNRGQNRAIPIAQWAFFGFRVVMVP